VALTWARREPPRPAAGVTTAAPPGGDPLEGLLALLAGGDEQAFAELYRRVAPAVFGLVTKVVRNPAQAEEVTQEVFVELWRTAPRFDPARGTARSWIMTCAHRRAVDRVRSAERAARRDDLAGRRDQGRPYDEVVEQVETGLERARPPGPGRPHRPPAGGGGARLLRRLHPSGDRPAARGAGGDGQDPAPRRAAPAPGPPGGAGVSAEPHALTAADPPAALWDRVRAETGPTSCGWSAGPARARPGWPMPAPGGG